MTQFASFLGHPVDHNRRRRAAVQSLPTDQQGGPSANVVTGDSPQPTTNTRPISSTPAEPYKERTKADTIKAILDGLKGLRETVAAITSRDGASSGNRHGVKTEAAKSIIDCIHTLDAMVTAPPISPNSTGNPSVISPIAIPGHGDTTPARMTTTAQTVVAAPIDTYNGNCGGGCRKRKRTQEDYHDQGERSIDSLESQCPQHRPLPLEKGKEKVSDDMMDKRNAAGDTPTPVGQERKEKKPCRTIKLRLVRVSREENIHPTSRNGGASGSQN